MGTAKIERNQLPPEEHRKNLLAILEGSRTGMLMTRSPEGRIAGRPMGIAKVDPDGTIYMTTGIDTPKAAELIRDPQTSVTAPAAPTTSPASRRRRTSPRSIHRRSSPMPRSTRARAWKTSSSSTSISPACGRMERST